MNYEMPPCGHCHHRNEYGVLVCAGANCGAQIWYGITPEELKTAFWIVFFLVSSVGVLLSAYAFWGNHLLGMTISLVIGGLLGAVNRQRVRDKYRNRVLFLRESYIS